MNKPQLLSTTLVGNVSDLLYAISQLPQELNELDESYVMNVYHDTASNEKWLEINTAE